MRVCLHTLHARTHTHTQTLHESLSLSLSLFLSLSLSLSLSLTYNIYKNLSRDTHVYVCLSRLAAAKIPKWKALHAATEMPARYRLQIRRQRRAAPWSSTCYRNERSTFKLDLRPKCGALCVRVLSVDTQLSNHFTNHFSQSWRCSTFYAKRPMGISVSRALRLCGYTRYSLRYSMHELPFGTLKCAMMASRTGTSSSRIRSHTRSLLLHELWWSNRSCGSWSRSCGLTPPWRSMIF
jgi:hypothetical protein